MIEAGEISSGSGFERSFSTDQVETESVWGVGGHKQEAVNV